IRPPIAWVLAIIAGLALNWLMPLPFLPSKLPAAGFGAATFVLALALAAWAITTMARAGSNVPTNLPTTTIVERTLPLHAQPHLPRHVPRSDRLDCRARQSLAVVMLVPFAIVIRYGVVAREEAYLERKFGEVYRGYRSRVRRWL